MIDADGLVLAAGRSSRMGSINKVQAVLAGRTLLDHVVAKLTPQVDKLLVNGEKAICGDNAIADQVEGFKGPLVGLYSALISDKLSSARYLMMTPCDGPFIPGDLVAALYREIVAADADIAYVRYQGYAQPTFSLWHKRVTSAVEESLLVKHNGGFKPLMASLNAVYLDWPEQGVNPFFNVNNLADLEEAERLLCL
jgi:molybdopterin-guanine dinucleotide biosynthesis protein A